jgi:bacteriocin-like protein
MISTMNLERRSLFATVTNEELNAVSGGVFALWDYANKCGVVISEHGISYRQEGATGPSKVLWFDGYQG